MVVDADEAAGEGEYLAEGDQHAAVYHARRRNTNPRHQEGTAEEDQQEREPSLTSGTSPSPETPSNSPLKGGELRASESPSSEGGVRGGLGYLLYAISSAHWCHTY